MAQTPQRPAVAFTIRLAGANDVSAIEWLDSFGTSPHRNISRHVNKYFGSVDPSIHERNVIFLAEVAVDDSIAQPFPAIGKAELLLAPIEEASGVGYIRRVVVLPQWRGAGVARRLLTHICDAAPSYDVRHLDLHVWDGNTSAVRLYESLGFVEQHRELYLRLNVAETDDTLDD